MLTAKQIEVICDGMCDACVLLIFEKQRESPSKEWTARQERKLRGGLAALNEFVSDKEYILEDKLTIGDIAIVTVLGFLSVRFKEVDWRKEFPKMAKYAEHLEERQSFKDTKPYPQTIKDKIV